jgi:4'-phosphopantetheinyl transferase
MMRMIPAGSPASVGAVEVRVIATDHYAIADRWADLTPLLSQAEHARSAQFQRAADRDSYIATRAALRMVLSKTIGVAPEAIKLDQNPWGKPVLAAEHQCQGLDFSVSHSAELSVIALSRTGAIGVDIERRRSVSDPGSVINDLLGERVARKLALLPLARQSESFFRLWTAAEAFVKAAGTGFAGNCGPIPLALAPDGLPQLAPGARRWSLVSIDPSPGYVGSLVVEADSPVPVCE